MRYRIVRNGLGEYGIVDEDNKLQEIPIFTPGVTQRPRWVKWAEFERATERLAYLVKRNAKEKLRNSWEVV
jgi:hypothetical protein